MRKVNGYVAPAVFGLLLGAVSAPAAERLVVTLTNDLPLSRSSETVVLDARETARALATDDMRRIHASDEQTGKNLPTQSVDLDNDGVMDQFLFQADLGAMETRRVVLTAGDLRIPKAGEYNAYGRFIRERFDDFAWENDRIAHRTYGKALETWTLEPLTSSAVDVWCKRTRRLVINDWYLTDDYHHDTGEGGDLYSAGGSRGCGGSGIWADGRLHVSRNFVHSKVIACGPIRIMFELTYEPWLVEGRRVAEVKRVTLDAGQNLSRFESEYLLAGDRDVLFAAGLKNAAGSTMRVDKTAGWMRTWESLGGENGELGCGVVFDPSALVEVTEADGNHLVVARAPSGQSASYHAGFGWNKSGDFANVADWDDYLERFAKRLRSPVKVSVKAE
ncbi:MAG: DUF4861 family protein [Vicinamibacteria bacterium]|nr:DUF4861 family protein [Vicinamibacteria bacterium]